MTIEEILAGESKNIEFKVSRPENSIKYIKSVIAFANGKGGHIVFGIDDATRDIVGIPDEIVFREMMPLRMPFRTVASLLLFRIFICRRLKGKQSLLWKSVPESKSRIISNRMA